MVTSEYTITFKEELGEFHLMLIGKLGTDFALNPNLRSVIVESDLDERDFLHLLSELVDVEQIGLIEHKRTLEPDWLSFNMEYSDE